MPYEATLQLEHWKLRVQPAAGQGAAGPVLYDGGPDLKFRISPRKMQERKFMFPILNQRNFIGAILTQASSNKIEDLKYFIRDSQPKWSVEEARY